MNFAFNSNMFGFRIVVDGEVLEGFQAASTAWLVTHPVAHEFDPSFNELVIVRYEEESHGFPDNVIVIWPLEERVDVRLIRFNRLVMLTADELFHPQHAWGLGRYPINLDDFGLTYPITIDDFIYNWEGIIGVVNAFTQTERDGFR